MDQNFCARRLFATTSRTKNIDKGMSALRYPTLPSKSQIILEECSFHLPHLNPAQ